MRFAISLLVIICVASVIGTVLPQNLPESNYIEQFGPFWYDVLAKFSVWSIYNSIWFLVIMAFLVVSTSVCLTRNTPKMIKDMRSFREHVRGSSLRAFHHRVELDSPRDLQASNQAVLGWFKQQGYAVKNAGRARGHAAGSKKKVWKSVGLYLRACFHCHHLCGWTARQ